MPIPLADVFPGFRSKSVTLLVVIVTEEEPRWPIQWLGDWASACCFFSAV
jgi:hypothetical protein